MILTKPTWASQKILPAPYDHPQTRVSMSRSTPCLGDSQTEACNLFSNQYPQPPYSQVPNLIHAYLVPLSLFDFGFTGVDGEGSG